MPIDPILPVYLNQRVVFDLTAMLEGGIATLTRVESAEKATNELGLEGTGNFGLAKAIASLVKIDFSGRARRGSSSASDETRTEDRVHTPASLLHRLRERLREENLVSDLDIQTMPQPGSIIEFETSVRRNPVTHALETIMTVMDMALQFTQPPSPGQGKKGGASRETLEAKKLRAQMEALQQRMTSGLTVDLLGSRNESGLSFLLTLEREYLNDPSMADLVDGRFRVLGKVIRVGSEGESVSLLRNTPLSAYKGETLAALMTAFEELGQSGDIVVPEMQWDVEGPFIHLLPVAVFA